MIKKGDTLTLKNSKSKVKVLAVVDDIVFVSEIDVFEITGAFYTMKEINDRFIVPAEKWAPKMNEQYFYLNSLMVSQVTTWSNDSLDKKLFELGNYFQTEEQAKLMADTIKELLLCQPR